MATYTEAVLESGVENDEPVLVANPKRTRL